MTEIPRGKPISRRRFLRGLGAAGLGLAAAQVADATGLRYFDTSTDPVSPLAGFDYPTALGLPFAHGVSSGDPLADRVILWTRITQVNPAGAIAVGWQVATDPALRNVVATGLVQTNAERDWTVKVDAAGLEPATTYYYAFHALGQTSIVGRTRTAPSPGSNDPVRMAVLSTYCLADRGVGHAGLAQRDDLDFVIHTGDPVYDRDGEVQEAPVGELDIRHCQNLDEVRRRHAFHLADLAVCRARQQHPFVAVWDGHDARPPGSATLEDCQQAFWEWTPARPPQADGSGRPVHRLHAHVDPEDPELAYRHIPYGGMADLLLLDARGPREGHASGPLGSRQQAWLQDATKASSQAGTAWRIVVNQVMLAPLHFLPPSPHTGEAYGVTSARPAGPVYASTADWDGSPSQRAQLLDHWQRHAPDTIVVTGDAHANWIAELKAPSAPRGAAPAAIEFAAACAPRARSAPVASGAAVEAALRRANSHLRLVDCTHHGYGLVHLNQGEAVLEFWWPGDGGQAQLGAQVRVPRGAQRILRVPEPSPSVGRTVPAAPTA